MRSSSIRVRPVRRKLAKGLLVAAAPLATALPVAPALAGGSGAAAKHPRAHAAITRLQVVEVEYSLGLSVTTVHAGLVDLEAVDRGRDAHDLRLAANGFHREVSGPKLTPGRHWGTAVHLRAGTYRLWCTLPKHARLGMHATLRVIP
ncbi:MAG TPA: hypothetical protein VH025_08525 [Solirubrobacteraceae bacterium]|jgi:hypothetical protein|nr:hypothetical protein [Solirubrobacteraceae bacterium]